MKNRDLILNVQRIQVLITVPLKGKDSIILIKASKTVSEACTALEAVRVKLCEDLCEWEMKDDVKIKPLKNYKGYIFTPDKQELLEKEYNEVLEQESGIEDIKLSTTEEQIEKLEGITPQQVEALFYFTGNKIN
jgi:hypothetical protein